MTSTQKINVDLSIQNLTPPPIIVAKQFDSQSRIVFVDIFDGGMQSPISSGATLNVIFGKIKNLSPILLSDITITSGRAKFVIPQNALAEYGTRICELQIVENNVVITTMNFYLKIEKSVLSKNMELPIDAGNPISVLADCAEKYTYPILQCISVENETDLSKYWQKYNIKIEVSFYKDGYLFSAKKSINAFNIDFSTSEQIATVNIKPNSRYVIFAYDYTKEKTVSTGTCDLKLIEIEDKSASVESQIEDCRNIIAVFDTDENGETQKYGLFKSGTLKAYPVGNLPSDFDKLKTDVDKNTQDIAEKQPKFNLDPSEALEFVKGEDGTPILRIEGSNEIYSTDGHLVLNKALGLKEYTITNPDKNGGTGVGIDTKVVRDEMFRLDPNEPLELIYGVDGESDKPPILRIQGGNEIYSYNRNLVINKALGLKEYTEENLDKNGNAGIGIDPDVIQEKLSEDNYGYYFNTSHFKFNDGVDINVDTELSADSNNPISNKAVYEAIQSAIGDVIGGAS